MTAPESSVMVPRRVPVLVWAIALDPNRAAASRKTNM
jgi:hypothetical protein